MPIEINKKNKSPRVEIIRAGKFDHRFYGNFEITPPDLQKMKTNFEADARRQKLDDKPVIPFDYGHYSEDEAAGWITALEISVDTNNFEALFAEVSWTDKGAEKIRANEYKFVSGEFRRDFKDAETGKIYDIILSGAALTNVPFIRDMEAVHLLSESRRAAFHSLKLSGDNPDPKPKKGSNMPDFNTILEGLKSVSPEDKKKLSEAVTAESQKLSENSGKLEKDLKKAQDDLKLSEKEIETLKEKMGGSTEVEDRLKLSESKAKDLSEKVSSLTKTLAENAQKSEFDKMLSEGKACEAQRKPFMSGNMAEFAKNAQEVKLDESGANATGDEKEGEAHTKVQKLAEEKMKADENIDYGAAVSQVLSENPALNKSLYPED